MFHRNPAVIEFVATELGDAQAEWFVKEYGGGVMVLEDRFGRAFISVDQLPECEDLEFVSRATA